MRASNLLFFAMYWTAVRVSLRACGRGGSARAMFALLAQLEHHQAAGLGLSLASSRVRPLVWCVLLCFVDLLFMRRETRLPPSLSLSLSLSVCLEHPLAFWLF